MFTKIKYFIKYGLFSFKIFENNLNDIILELKKLYYESRSDNLIKEIEKLKTSLNNYNIKKKWSITLKSLWKYLNIDLQKNIKK